MHVHCKCLKLQWLSFVFVYHDDINFIVFAQISHSPYRKISPAANICRTFAANTAAKLQQTLAENLSQPFYHANEGCDKLAANIIMQIRFAASFWKLFAASLRQLFVENLLELYIKYQCRVCRHIQFISFKLHSNIFKSQFLLVHTCI